MQYVGCIQGHVTRFSGMTVVLEKVKEGGSVRLSPAVAQHYVIALP